MGGWSDGRWWEFDLQWRTSEWEETQGIAVCFFEPCLTSNFGWSNLRQLRVLSFPFWNALWLACLQCQKNKDIFYSLLKTLTFTSYSVLPFNEMQTHLGWKLVHFSLSVVIGTKILVLKEYNKKKMLSSHCSFAILFKLFICWLSLIYIWNVSQSLYKTSNVFFHLYSCTCLRIQNVWPLVKLCSISGFCLGP